MKKAFQKLWQDESAQGVTEYALIVLLIVAVVTLFGKEFQTAIQDKVTELSDQIKGASFSN